MSLAPSKSAQRSPVVAASDAHAGNRLLATLKRIAPADDAWLAIHVLDREGLEAAACECYAIVRGHFDRLLAE